MPERSRSARFQFGLRNAIGLDVGLIAFSILIWIAGLSLLFFFGLAPNLRTSANVGALVAFISFCVTTTAGIVGFTVFVVLKRLDLQLVLGTDISSICYGIQRIHMFQFWQALYDDPLSVGTGWADTPREEDYFSVYHSCGLNIGSLRRSVAEPIIHFYVLLKFSRDAAGALKTWNRLSGDKTDSIKRQHVMYIVALLVESILWGYVALYRLGYRANETHFALRDAMRLSYNDLVAAEGRSQEHLMKPKDFDQLLDERHFSDVCMFFRQ